MGKRRSPDQASDREKKWDKIFKAFVKLSQNQHNDMQILEERVKHFHGIIYKMKMEQKVDSLKAELMMGLKERECTVLKHRYENTENDVEDFREWCDYLVQKCSGLPDISIDVNNEVESSRNKALLDQVRKLKSDNDTVFLVQLNCGVKLTLNLNSPSKSWKLYNEGDLR